MRLGKLCMGVFVALFALIIVGCQSSTHSEESGETNATSTSHHSENGGELRVGVSAQPPTLDSHKISSIATLYVISQFYESLVAVNSHYEVIPQLAESVDQSEDGKTYTFQLREGVLFHNGKEMKAEDVVASLNRWKDISPTGILKSIQEGSFSAKDEYTVVLEVLEPSPLILLSMASNRYAAVMPKEVVESADTVGISEFIGTGPFKFVEWKQDQYIHLTKFEDYEPIDLPADGASGKKEALVDDLYFDIVTDASTQVAGIQTGEYDIILDLPNEHYEQVKANGDVQVDVGMYGTMNVVFNKNQGLFADRKMRQAVNAALDFDEILLASFINEDLYRANSSYMLEEKGNWYTEAGSEFYNEQNIEKAKKLLEESGYSGETVRLLTTRDYEHIYNTSVVVKEQLEQIGIPVELEVYDWPTVKSKVDDPETWELFATGYDGKSTPLENVYFNENFISPPVDEKTIALLRAIETSPTEGEAYDLWYELQAHAWEALPIIKLGDFPKISVLGNHVKGYEYFNAMPILWNTSVSK